MASDPNNSFKPNLLRYTKALAEKACHGFGSTTQVGLTQALGLISVASPIETSLAIRVFTSDVAGQQKMFAFINATNDPRAHGAWCKVNLDLTKGLGLTVKASSGVVAFAERFDTFEFGESEVYLHYEGDPGDLTLSANNNSDLNLLIQKLEALGGYVVTHVP